MNMGVARRGECRGLLAAILDKSLPIPRRAAKSRDSPRRTRNRRAHTTTLPVELKH